VHPMAVHVDQTIFRIFEKFLLLIKMTHPASLEWASWGMTTFEGKPLRKYRKKN